jgi:hypothetical protein
MNQIKAFNFDKSRRHQHILYCLFQHANCLHEKVAKSMQPSERVESITHKNETKTIKLARRACVSHSDARNHERVMMWQ